MNETCSIDAKCILAFNINEQLTVTVQKTNNVNKIFTIAINTAFKDKNSITFETYFIF